MKIIFQTISVFLLLSTTIPNYAQTPTDCGIDNALQLYNQPNPPLPQIKDVLNHCDKTKPNNVNVLLLHGLLTRKEGQANHNYHDAITWFQKAVAVAAPDNNAPSLELATTYEWDKQQSKAQNIYKQLLVKNSNLRPALLGSANVGIAQNNLQYSTNIYQKLLQQNPNDVDALNGLGRIKLAEGKYSESKDIFTKVLQISPNNSDADVGLEQANKAEQPTKSNLTNGCQTNEGLTLLNRAYPPITKIKSILSECDKVAPNDVQVLLLHGLLARKEGLPNKNFASAIHWLKKAVAVATPDNNAPALELATTYEWASQGNEAKKIYSRLLVKNPNLRPALLGLANVGIAQKQLQYSQNIYDKLLKQNHNDVDALNGLGRIQLANQNFPKAKSFFEKALKIDPNNKDSQIGLEQSKKRVSFSAATKNCPVDEGLKLVNETKPPVDKILAILTTCDKENPNDVQVLMLHGLLARKEGMDKKDYDVAISWFQKAALEATPDNYGPELELATTYEWASQPLKAKVIYISVLNMDPNNRAALLGLASVDRARYNFKESMAIYQKFLEKNPNDVDALIGIASIDLANKKFDLAKKYYLTAQSIQPNNQDVNTGLQMLNDATKYRISLSDGVYGIGDIASNSSAITFVADLNATDQLYLLLVHNTKEIQLGQVFNPTFLPKNSFLIGFQRQYSERYGWGFNYDYRQHVNQGTENHVEINGDIYLLPQFQVYGGMRESFPTPFNYQLYWAGGTLITNIPVNFSLTAFLGIQEEEVIGTIRSPAYSFDLSKEFSNKTYYDIGVAYLPPERNNPWSVHGNFAITTFKNQALEAWYEYYWFNSSYYAGLGWRFYW